MAIFRLQHATVTLTVRAVCFTCARNLAADNAGPEGPRAWRDPTRSTIEYVRTSTGFDPAGPTQILNRKEVSA